jgi:hypothetical protein
MPTNEDGIFIGTQNVAQGSPIQPRIPSELNPGFPQPGDARADNIKFNTDDHWILIDPNTGESLPEGSNFNYGQNISVKATWWKKVNIVIWCRDGTDISSQAVTDLRSRVHTLTENATPGHYPGPNGFNQFAFFSDGDNVLFTVTDADSNKVVHIPNTNRYYRFIGWSEEEPILLSSALNPFQWCSFDLEHLHRNVEFDENCLKDEYAVFAGGENSDPYGNIEIFVTTNGSDDQNSPYYQSWDNTEKIEYKIVWGIDDEYNPHIQPFNSVPVDSNLNPKYQVENSHIPDYFSIETYNPSTEGNYHYLSGRDENDNIVMYELQGWYLGVFKGFDPVEVAAIMQDTDRFIHGDVLRYVNTVYTPIELTAIYMPSQNQYTITYYSGLPELNG